MGPRAAWPGRSATLPQREAADRALRRRSPLRRHCCCRRCDAARRCADLQGLDDAGLKDCLRAASLKLLFPGSLKPGSAAAGEAAAQPQQQQQAQAGGRGSAQDLASLHAQFHGAAGSRGGAGSVENMLSRSLVATGGWGFAEQAFVVIALLGAAGLGYTRWQRWRAARAKSHSRSE